MWPDMARRNRNRPRGAALPVTPPSTQPDPDASAPSGAAAPPSVPGSSSDAAGTVTSASAPGSSSGAAAPEHPADNSALPRASAARLPGRAGCPAVAGNAAAPAPAGGTGAATAASAMPSTPLHTQGNRAGISAPAVGAPDSASVSTAATAAAEAWDSMAPAVAWAGLDQNTKDMLIWLHSNMPDPTEVHLGSLKVLVAELQAQGEHYKVRPLLCFCTFRHGAVCGLDADSTVAAALDVLKTDSLCGTVSLALLIWVLPRAAYSPTFGLAHPAFTTVIQLAARYLYWSKDPRQLTELAQQLPGGLGWGSTVVAPVPDEEAYARHCVMHAKAGDAAGQGHYALAKDMLTRCVAYFKTLGSHWLGTQRKIVAMIHLAGCVGHLEGWEAAERLYVQAKRTAQEELGRGNEATLAVTWVYAKCLAELGRNEQALSLYTTLLRKRKELLGPDHVDVIATQSSMALIFVDIGKFREAEDMARDAFHRALRVAGPDDPATERALDGYAKVFWNQNAYSAIEVLKQMALALGIDWDAAVVYPPNW